MRSSRCAFPHDLLKDFRRRGSLQQAEHLARDTRPRDPRGAGIVGRAGAGAMTVGAPTIAAEEQFVTSVSPGRHARLQLLEPVEHHLDRLATRRPRIVAHRLIDGDEVLAIRHRLHESRHFWAVAR